MRYKTKMLFSLEQGKLDEVAHYALKTCYEETDIVSLQEQNTEFLFEVLDAYDNYSICNTYAQKGG